MPGEVNLEGKATRGGGMLGAENRGTGREMDIKKKHGKC